MSVYQYATIVRLNCVCYMLQWLEHEFMGYLEEWKKFSEKKGGEQKEVAQRLLSQETLQGISVTGKPILSLFNIYSLIDIVWSFVELVPYILKIPGVRYFLSEHLSQDPLENFFGCQRQRGRTNENPTCAGFVKNTQALQVINSVAGDVPKGNCRGRKNKINVEEENIPLPKRRRKHK